MFKKILVSLAVLLVAVFILSACGGKTTTATTTAPPTQPAITTTSKPVTTTTNVTTAAPATTTAPAATTVPVVTTTAPVATTKAPKSGGVFRFADPRGPSTTLGWFAEAGAQGGMWTMPCIETLLEVDMNNNYLPWLATDWKITDDLSAVTLTLRKGVKFHDGSDFNATVAKWNIDQMIAAKVAVNYSYMTAVEAVDDYTLKSGC
jgi:ABC-type transport system substrate-binding protein